MVPGVLDHAARDAFGRGACGALALALHEKTGWPLIAVTDSHNVAEGRAGGGSALHYAVRTPEGLLLDVDGLHSTESLIERFSADADEGEAAAGVTTVADIREWYVEAQGEPIPISLARTFVAAVLELYNTQRADG